MLDSLSPRALVEFIIKTVEIYTNSLSNPQQFLTPRIPPSDKQILDGMEFYLTLFSLCFVLNLPFVFTFKGELQDKVRLAVLVVFGLISAGLVALIFHFPFWLLGGEGTFAGTFLAMAYAYGPFMVLMTISALIFLA